MNKKDIVNPSIRLPKELKEKGEERAKNYGLTNMQDEPNFSKYVRWLINKDIEGKVLHDTKDFSRGLNNDNNE